MIRLFDNRELAARKELLVAESELRRETLKVELQNIQIYVAGVKGRINAFRSSGLFVLFSSLGSFFAGSSFARGKAQKRPRRGRIARVVMGGLFGLRLYRKLRPVLRLLSRRFGRNGAEAVEEEEKMSAANI